MCLKYNFLILAFIVVVSPDVSGQTIIDSRSQDIVITHVSVIPMDTETVLADQTVTIKDGKIKSIETTRRKPAKRALVIDGQGKYLMPGLAEMHAHVPPNDDVQQAKEVNLRTDVKAPRTNTK